MERFVNGNKKNLLAKYFMIQWLLENRIVTSTILTLIAEMGTVQTTFVNTFLAYYSKAAVSKKLGVLYYSRHLFFNSKKDLRSISFKNVFQTTEKFIEKEVDLNYAI